MRISVTKVVPPDVANTWGSEPNDRAPVKMAVAEAMGRIARTHDLIVWHEQKMADGSMMVTGLLDISEPRRAGLPDYELYLDPVDTATT